MFFFLFLCFLKFPRHERETALNRAEQVNLQEQVNLHMITIAPPDF